MDASSIFLVSKKYFDILSKRKYTVADLRISRKKMKQSTITFKTTPEIKEALEKLAKQGFRSRSAQIEMIVVKYLEAEGIGLNEESKKKGSK